MTAKTLHPQVPAALSDVAMIDGATCAAAAGISISGFHDEVREGKAPQPVIRRPRCTRWLLSDVRAWLIKRASQGADPQVIATAVRASRAAQAKRKARSEATQ